MRANEAYFLRFLQTMPQFVVPTYQRPYSWGKRECAQLWDDIVAAGSSDAIKTHFLGAIVYVQAKAYQVTGWAPPLIIDGQQRLTTGALLLEATARHLGDTEPLAGFSARELRDRYLRNVGEHAPERQFKLLLTHDDRDTLLAVLSQAPLPSAHSRPIAEALAFFEQRVRALGTDVQPLCKGLVKLLILDVTLEPEQDDPQRIFESMNATGRGLTAADLIRNFLLMDQDADGRDRLYTTCWRPMERRFGPSESGRHVGHFVRHFLALHTATTVKRDAVYERFKDYARSVGVAEVAADLHARSAHYAAIALGGEQHPALGRALADLRSLRTDAASPFVLQLYHDYAGGVLSAADFERLLRLVESYLFRRSVCGLHGGAHRALFAGLARAVRPGHYCDSVQAHLLRLPPHTRFPDDEEFRRRFEERNFYRFEHLLYALGRLERHGRREFVPIRSYTVEHIVPQTPNLHPSWRAALGPHWRRVHDAWVHTIGNLTLTGYNAEYGARPFAQKRDMRGGFHESPLWLNADLRTLEAFDEGALHARAARLAARALALWPMPAASALHACPAPAEARVFTVDDHQHLRPGAPMHDLYGALRSALLALGPGVTERPCKHYIAFKARSNFVDVEPLRHCLRLMLNLRFDDLDDPWELAENLTGRWHRGNGDAAISLDRAEALPYVMRLVRQAFERQASRPGASAPRSR